MERRTLGATGIAVPVIGLGGHGGFNVEGAEAIVRCEAVVDAAVLVGANLIDTSPMHGHAEDVIAIALEGRRRDVVLTTKVWARTRAIGEDQIQHALECFEHVDLYQVQNLLGFADHRRLLESLRERGRIGAIGASHYLHSGVEELARLAAAGQVGALEVPYHPGERMIEQRLLPLAADLGIGVIATMSLASRRGSACEPTAALAPLAPFGVQTWSQALLKWALSDRRVGCVVVSASSVADVREHAAAGSPPWLGPDERRYVERLAAVHASA